MIRVPRVDSSEYLDWIATGEVFTNAFESQLIKIVLFNVIQCRACEHSRRRSGAQARFGRSEKRERANPFDIHPIGGKRIGVDLALTLAPALFVEGTGIFDTTRLSKEA
jgi:hypothetical protein